MLIAMDLEMSLQDLGWNVVGPVAQADRALRLVETEKLDIGLLDYNLVSGTSEQIAMALLKKSIPVIFLSGDTLRKRSEHLKHCKVIAKPVNIDKLNEALRSALE